MGVELMNSSQATGLERKRLLLTSHAASLSERTGNRCYYCVIGKCSKPGIDPWSHRLQFALSGSMPQLLKPPL